MTTVTSGLNIPTNFGDVTPTLKVSNLLPTAFARQFADMGEIGPNQALQPTADRQENLHMTTLTLKFAAQLALVSGG